MAGPNQLGGKILLDIFSKKHVLYNSKNAQQGFTSFGLADPNLDEYDRRVIGKEGIVYNEQTFTDQPWSYTIETFKALSAFLAILTDQNPEDAESEASASAIVGLGGTIGLSDKIDLISNFLDNNRENVIGSIVYIDSGKNKKPVEIPMTGTISVSLSGVAKRGFMFNKPVYREGWQSDIDVSQQGTPNTTALVGSGPAWLRRDAGTYEPRRVFFKGATTAAFSVCASDSRIDALVLYETGMDYNDLALTIVEGTPGASPSAPADGDIDTAIDAISSGARWCRLANVTVDEPVTVEIETADIAAVTATVFTFNKTALAIPTKFKEDATMMNDYAIAVWEDGEYKDNKIGIASDSSSALTYSLATSNMIDVCYMVEPFEYTDPLS